MLSITDSIIAPANLMWRKCFNLFMLVGCVFGFAMFGCQPTPESNNASLGTEASKKASPDGNVKAAEDLTKDNEKQAKSNHKCNLGYKDDRKEISDIPQPSR